MTQEMVICDWMVVILFTAQLTNILMWLDGFAIDNSGLFYVYNRTHQDFSHISVCCSRAPDKSAANPSLFCVLFILHIHSQVLP